MTDLQVLRSKPFEAPVAALTLPVPLEHDRPEEEKLFCAACGVLVTLGRWRIAMNGAHEHTVFNPAGAVFTVLCFRDALAARTFGPFSEDFTWFKGYAWQIVLCTDCGTHLGWRYGGEAETPPGFFGFIKDRLTTFRPENA